MKKMQEGRRAAARKRKEKRKAAVARMAHARQAKKAKVGNKEVNVPSEQPTVQINPDDAAAWIASDTMAQYLIDITVDINTT